MRPVAIPVMSFALFGVTDPPQVRLPDGTVFESWEQPLTFRRTSQVDQGNPHASDRHKGTARNLLAFDDFGRPRSSAAFQIGPIPDLPLDSTAISVDPRVATYGTGKP